MPRSTIYSGHRQGCPTIRTADLTTTANAVAAVAGRAGQAITLQVSRNAWLVFGSQTSLDAWVLARIPPFMEPLGIVVELDIDDAEQLTAPTATSVELAAAVAAASQAKPGAPFRLPRGRCQWINVDGARCTRDFHDDDQHVFVRAR